MDDVGATGYPPLYLCTKMIRWVSRTLIPFIDWVGMHDASGITMYLDLDCLSLLILNCIYSWVLCPRVTNMFINLILPCFGRDHMKNLDDGLGIPLMFRWFRCLTKMLRLGGSDCKALKRTTLEV